MTEKSPKSPGAGKLITDFGKALRKQIHSKIEEPLPLLPKSMKSKQEQVPKFTYPHISEGLGPINGRPFRSDTSTHEMLLSEYVKQAYEEKSLVYSRQALEVCKETNELLNDPIKNLINLVNLDKQVINEGSPLLRKV